MRLILLQNNWQGRVTNFLILQLLSLSKGFLKHTKHDFMKNNARNYHTIYIVYFWLGRAWSWQYSGCRLKQVGSTSVPNLWLSYSIPVFGQRVTHSTGNIFFVYTGAGRKLSLGAVVRTWGRDFFFSKLITDCVHIIKQFGWSNQCSVRKSSYWNFNPVIWIWYLSIATGNSIRECQTSRCTN